MGHSPPQHGLVGLAPGTLLSLSVCVCLRAPPWSFLPPALRSFPAAGEVDSELLSPASLCTSGSKPPSCRHTMTLRALPAAS